MHDTNELLIRRVHVTKNMFSISLKCNCRFRTNIQDNDFKEQPYRDSAFMLKISVHKRNEAGYYIWYIQINVLRFQTAW
jgi:hypothetical protein